MHTFKNPKEAENIIGGLSNPSKMPCSCYSLPASACKMGMLMAKNPNSICAGCYARKGRYGLPSVKKSLQRRLESLQNPLWVDAMTYLLKDMPYFRWHDSGDIQDMRHLSMIVDVVKNTPDTMHWIATREYGIITEWIRTRGAFPENFIVRLSATKIDGAAPTKLAESLGVLVSGVMRTDYDCPASHQNNECKKCRRCWDKNVFQVNYKKH